MIIRIQIFLTGLLLRVIKRMIFNKIATEAHARWDLEELEIRRNQVKAEIKKLKRRKKGGR